MVNFGMRGGELIWLDSLRIFPPHEQNRDFMSSPIIIRRIRIVRAFISRSHHRPHRCILGAVDNGLGGDGGGGQEKNEWEERLEGIYGGKIVIVVLRTLSFQLWW